MYKWPHLLCFAVRMPNIHLQAICVRNKAQINQVPVQNATYNAATTSKARHATGAPHHTRCYSVTCVCTAQKLFLQVVTMGIFGLGGPEIAVIAGVAVLIFGEHLCSAKAPYVAALRLCWQLAVFVTCRPQQNSRLGKRGRQGSQELSASSQGMRSWHTAKQKAMCVSNCHTRSFLNFYRFCFSCYVVMNSCSNLHQ